MIRMRVFMYDGIKAKVVYFENDDFASAYEGSRRIHTKLPIKPILKLVEN